MNCYEELQARGLIAQVTDEKEIRDLKNSMSFRLGRIMTKPGRTVRDLLKKRSH